MTSYTDAERVRFLYELIADLIENPAANLVGSAQAWCNADEDPTLSMTRTIAMGAEIEDMFAPETADPSPTNSPESDDGARPGGMGAS